MVVFSGRPINYHYWQSLFWLRSFSLDGWDFFPRKAYCGSDRVPPCAIHAAQHAAVLQHCCSTAFRILYGMVCSSSAASTEAQHCCNAVAALFGTWVYGRQRFFLQKSLILLRSCSLDARDFFFRNINLVAVVFSGRTRFFLQKSLIWLRLCS